MPIHRVIKASLLAVILAMPAAAQQRQPAQITTLPATPQEFDILDMSGHWLPFGYGDPTTHTFNAWLKSNIDPRTYGAKCDGVTDDTVALQAWTAAAVNNARMFVPGVCMFSGPLVFPPTVTGVTLMGDGRPGQLIYTGASTVLSPIIQIGDPTNTNGCPAKGWTINGIMFTSNTKMTYGDGLQLNGICASVITNLTVGDNLGTINKNFYNAIHYNGGNSVYTRGFGFAGSNTGLIVNGGPTNAFTDPEFLQGWVVYSLVGVHICGNVGGFVGDFFDVLENGTNVLIDRACANVGNTQLMFGPHFMSDVTDSTDYPIAPQVGIHMSDPGGPQTVLIYRGWLASASEQCFVYDAGTPDNPSYPPIVIFSGATIANCHSPGSARGAAIDNQNTYAQISVTGTRFWTSSSPTIYNISGAPAMTLQSLTVDSSFNITGAWVGSYVGANGIITATPFQSLTANNIVSNGPGAVFQWQPKGGTQPADTKNWDMFENSATGDMSLRVLNDALGTATSYVTYYRGTTYTLAGAKVAFSEPLIVPGYTIGTNLPACNGTFTGSHAFVYNGQTSPPYLGVVGTTGAVIVPVFCNGTNWVYH